MMRCGLLGKKLGYSYSPRVHGLLAPGAYSYELIERSPGELEAFFTSGEYDGFNVTIPYKKEAVKWCSELSAAAKTLGSVNTVVKRADGSLYGDNTDLYGFEKLLEAAELKAADAGQGVKAEPLKGKKALVLGSGGAGVTVCAALRGLGADVTVISRSGPDNYENLERHKNASVIVNATPVGTFPDVQASPLDLRRFEALEAVLDIVYNPARTALMLQAEELGIPAFGGLTMLVAQARRSSELFTSCSINDEAMERALAEVSFELGNIVLIGMPGCGKTTVAGMLGRLTGRRVADADALIEERAGCSIPKIFEAHGEEGFRKIESEVLFELGRQSGLIIATGGGAVTVPGNYAHLHRNGSIVWLQRSLDRLPRDGRPISLKSDLAQMQKRREPMYERFADCCADNNRTPEECATDILKMLGSGAFDPAASGKDIEK